jgi:hypothetical protein
VEYRLLGRTGLLVSPMGRGRMMFGPWGNDDGPTRSASFTSRWTRASISSTRKALKGPPRRRRPGHEILHADGRRAQPQRGIAQVDHREVEDSWRRLGTDHLDLYQVHRPSPVIDVAETLGALPTSSARQGPLPRVVVVLRQPDRRGAVGVPRSSPRAVRQRAGVQSHSAAAVPPSRCTSMSTRRYCSSPKTADLGADASSPERFRLPCSRGSRPGRTIRPLALMMSFRQGTSRR